MPEIIDERVTAELDGDFVVFRIGMRINTLWKVQKWLPVFLAMPRLLSELEEDPTSGLLGYHRNLGIRNHMLLQYWESFEKLRSYALDPDARHAPAMKWTNRIVGETDAVGIWHETYLVREGDYETIYHNMPPRGLAKVGDLHAATGPRKSATGRFR
jgi:hypothetical protein